MELKLKYGCNPNQAHARLLSPGDGPLRIRNGEPSYINLLDALRGWQHVRDLKRATGKPAAASYKHCSPAGAAVAAPVSETFGQAHFFETQNDLSPIAAAYMRSRSSDRTASFGDVVAVSERVDRSLAQVLKSEVSDAIIAPGYDEAALDILASKKRGGYLILEMEPTYEPPPVESRVEFGLTLEQSRNEIEINRETFSEVVTAKTDMPEPALEALVLSTVAIKHTQSNSIAVGYEGQAIGVGAGQQSRIACTRLACEKAEQWMLKAHPKALGLAYREQLSKPERINASEAFVRWDRLNDAERAGLLASLEREPEPITAKEREQWLSAHKGLALSSDAFIPFRDNVDRAAASGVGYLAQPGGSRRDGQVTAAADEHEMVMAHTHTRLFLH